MDDGDLDLNNEQSTSVEMDLGERLLQDPFPSKYEVPEELAQVACGNFDRLKAILNSRSLKSALTNKSPLRSAALKATERESSTEEEAEAEPFVEDEEGEIVEDSSSDDEQAPVFRHAHPQRKDPQQEEDQKDFITFDKEGLLEDSLMETTSNSLSRKRKRRESEYIHEVREQRSYRHWRHELTGSELRRKVEQVIEEWTIVRRVPVWAGEASLDGSVRREGSSYYAGTNLQDIMNQEILDFVQYISPTMEEHKMRLYCLHRITTAVHSIWPDAAVQCFGSFETKLYLPTSDMDIVVFPKTSSTSVQLLNKLGRKLRKSDIVFKDSLRVIKARVPIVKFVENVTQFSIDISFNIEQGLKSAEVMNTYLKQYEALRPLVCLLKLYLHMRGLNEVFSGGLGSYGLTILVASFLELHPKLQKRCIRPMENLGVLLMEFLELYGKHFNYDDVGISMNPARFYFIKGKDSPLGVHLGGRAASILCVEDPADSTNDITRGSFNYWQVQKSLAHALDVLQGTFFELHERSRLTRPSHLDDRSETLYRIKSILGTIVSIPQSVVRHRQFVRDTYYEMQDQVDLALDVQQMQHAQMKMPRNLFAIDSNTEHLTFEERMTANKLKKKKKKKKTKQPQAESTTTTTQLSPSTTDSAQSSRGSPQSTTSRRKSPSSPLDRTYRQKTRRQDDPAPLKKKRKPS